MKLLQGRGGVGNLEVPNQDKIKDYILSSNRTNYRPSNREQLDIPRNKGPYDPQLPKEMGSSKI